MSHADTYGLPRADELEQLYAIIDAALHFGVNGVARWAELFGTDNMRAVRLNNTVVGGLGLIPMGQWFGGALVPMVGLTAVGIAPEHRGSGVGKALLHGVLHELHKDGVALSALYPATVAFYRRVGYERAGQRLSYELPLHAIDTGSSEGQLERFEGTDQSLPRELYAAWARTQSSLLERPAWMWQRRLNPPDQPQVSRFLIRFDGALEGYVVYSQGTWSEPLQIHDLCVASARAGRRLLGLLAGYRSIVAKVTWHGGPLDPLRYLLRENFSDQIYAGATVARALDWMLRIVDVRAALERRGYPEGLRAELHFELRDAVLPGNAGRWLLEVADGRGQLTRGGEGRISLDITDLAALYTGFMAPSERVVLGALAGPAADLGLLAAVFSGPRPYLSDMF
jgi:predicted acetyltransferase